MGEIDSFDPNNWDLDWRFRMYAGVNADVECLVDEEDYQHFTQWLWVQKRSPCGKLYFRRAISTYDLTGERLGSETIYLHVEICRRVHGEMPTRARRIVDHKNGNSLDNQRHNLCWATPLENNRNRFGSTYRQGALAL